MQEIQDLEFTHFIVHVVDHKTGRLELSDLETPIGPDSDFPHDLFKGYVLGAATDTNRRLALFASPRQGVVCQAYRNMRRPNQQFISVSQRIAEKLYETMTTSDYKAQIHPGDIMVTLFRRVTDGGPEGPHYMAILKIDPTSVITREVVQQDGHRQVVFDESSSIPDPDESRIQKIALVSPERVTKPRHHDLVILDNNLRNRLVAYFFFRDFLESKLVKTPSVATDLLIEGLKRFLSEDGDAVDPGLSGGEKFQVLDQADDAIARLERLSPEMLAQEAIVLPERPAADVARLREALIAQYRSPPRAEDKIQPAEKVRTDPVTRVQRTQKMTITLDGGVRIVGDKDKVRGLIHGKPKLDAAGRTVFTIKSHVFRTS